MVLGQPSSRIPSTTLGRGRAALAAPVLEHLEHLVYTLYGPATQEGTEHPIDANCAEATMKKP
jgi:hypothetical protein